MLKGRIARAAASVGLGLALAAAPTMGTVCTAFAADGSVTIAQAHNTGAKYDGYRLFKADVDADDKATNITWEDNGIKSAVLAYLDTQGYAAWLASEGHTAAVDGVAAHDIAQNAADFISEKIQGSATDTEAGTTPRTTRGDSFANGLARAIAGAGIAAQTPAGGQNTGAAFTGPQGYYLFVTHDEAADNTIGVGEAGTAPIWVAVGATAKNITEKSAVPTVTKTVREDASGAYGESADANRAQDVDFRLEGTVAADANAFESYFYEFTDTMTGLEMGASDVAALTVKVDGSDVTNAVKAQEGSKVEFAGGKLTVTIPDLLALGRPITKDTVVVVDYKAHLNADAVCGSTGNPNTVSLNYSSDPAKTSAHTSTPEKTVRTYAYAIKVVKVDQDTREVLPGAKFTIQVADGNTDAASKGKYVQADGSLGATAYEFTTDASGEFQVLGIDEGVYTIRETAAPADHKQLAADVTLTVTGTRDAAGALTALAATVSGGNGLFVTNPAAHQDGVTGTVIADGTVSARISDKKETYLPGTGLTTSAAGVVVGFTLITGGLVGLGRAQRRKAGGNDAE